MTNKKILSIFSLLLIAALALTACAPQRTQAAQESSQSTLQKATVLEAPTAVPVQSGTGDNTLEALQAAYERLYEQVSPSVVHIQVVKSVSSGQSPFPQNNLPAPFFNFPFGEPNNQSPRQFRQESIGSGFVWDSEGHIVTNNHVVEGADQVTVTFADGTSLEAKVVGTDPDSDLGVIKVDPSPLELQPITLADSTKVRVGQIAIAIGAPFGLQESMTTGIVSAMGRSLQTQNGTSQGGSYTIPDVIQTDAPINPGNSGGVLIDSQGALIGVTTAIESPVRANAGIGFVIPSIIVKNVVPELIERGFYEHPWIGISGHTLGSEIAKTMKLDPTQHGVLVVDVVPASPAEDAGLRGSDRTTKINDQEVRIGGDVIVAIDGQPVNDFEDLTAYLARYTHAGDTVTVGLLRNGKSQEVELTLGVRPTQSGKSSGATAGRVWLGVRVIPLNKDIAAAMDLAKSQDGLLIQQVIQDSPADKAGLRGSYKSLNLGGQTVLIGGDIITAIDGREVASSDALQSILSTHKSGDEITVTIVRDGKEMTVPLTLAPAP